MFGWCRHPKQTRVGAHPDSPSANPAVSSSAGTIQSLPRSMAMLLSRSSAILLCPSSALHLSLFPSPSVHAHENAPPARYFSLSVRYLYLTRWHSWNTVRALRRRSLLPDPSRQPYRHGLRSIVVRYRLMKSRAP